MQTLQHTTREVWLNIGAVMVALVVVHILGRFIFTPLMPYFIDDGLFTLAQSADLASINYLGYLVGALLAVFFATPHWIKKILLANIALNILSTVLQCATTEFYAMMLLRLLNGVSNGTVFVLAPALMLEWLHARGKAHLSGLMYFGVSAGLMASGLLTSSTAHAFSGSDRWLPVAALACLLGAYAMYRLAKVEVHLPVAKSNVAPQPLFDRQSTLLFLAYLGAGFGYILPMTFLPTLAFAINAHEPLNAHLWTMVALSCLITTPLWNKLGAVIGDKKAIIISYWVQAFGVGMLLLLPNIWGLILCAVGVGGGFLGSVMCTQRYARALQPSQGVKLSAVLITIYAGAQLVAPLAAKGLMSAGVSLFATFVLGFVAFIWSFVMMVLIKD